MAWSDIVNSQQRASIEASGHCSVVAGPGTGKTRTLLARAVQLIEDEVAPAAAIRIVNFTNAGVRDLQRKVLEVEDYDAVSHQNITTFHSLALRVLRVVNATTVPSPLLILDDWEERTFIDRFATDRLDLKNIRNATSMRIDYNSRWCMARVEIDDWLAEKSRRQYEGVYQEAKELLGFTTRGELTFLWWRYLRSLPGKPDAESVGFRADFLLVDEYQDLNECEHEVLERLAEAGMIIFAVGDPNQCIYETLRHAHPQFCWDFPQRLPDAELHVLERSYRCPKAVLRYASALLGDNDGLPDIESSRVEGEAHVLSFPAHDGEASGLALLAKHLIDKDPSARVLFAVPTKAMASIFEVQLSAIEVDVENRTKRDEEYSLECRMARSLLRLLREPRDSVAAATAIILSCARTTRPKRVLELLALAHERGEKVAVLLAGNVDPSGPLEKALVAVRDALESLRAADDVTEKLREITGCDDIVGEPEALEEKLERLLDDPAALDSGKVTIMTLHGSKGLEAEWVILPAVEPGFYERDEVGARKEERRRLLFVGMTRALSGTFLTFARRRYGPDVTVTRLVRLPERAHLHLSMISATGWI